MLILQIISATDVARGKITGPIVDLEQSNSDQKVGINPRPTGVFL